jgi:hypothetical protein
LHFLDSFLSSIIKHANSPRLKWPWRKGATQACVGF